MKAYFIYTILFLNFCIALGCKTPKGENEDTPSQPTGTTNPNTNNSPSLPTPEKDKPDKPAHPTAEPKNPPKDGILHDRPNNEAQHKKEGVQSSRLQIKHEYPEHESIISDRRPRVAVAFTEDFQFQADDPKFFVLDSSLRRLVGVYGKEQGFDGNRNTLYIMHFTPSQDLEFGAIYTVNVSRDVQTLDGKKLGADYEWNFRTSTESPRTIPLEIPTPPADVAGEQPVVTAFQQPTITARKKESDATALVVTVSFSAPITCQVDLRTVYFQLAEQNVNAEFECDESKIEATFTFNDGGPSAHTEYKLFTKLDIKPKNQPMTNGIIEKGTYFKFTTGDLN